MAEVLMPSDLSDSEIERIAFAISNHLPLVDRVAASVQGICSAIRTRKEIVEIANAICDEVHSHKEKMFRLEKEASEVRANCKHPLKESRSDGFESVSRQCLVCGKDDV